MVALDFTGHASIRQRDELGNLSRSMFTLSQSLDTALGELRETNQQLVEEMEQKKKLEQMQQDFLPVPPTNSRRLLASLRASPRVWRMG